MTIDIASRSVYGNTLYYPICDRAKAVQKLTGKKTLTLSDMAALEALGVHCRIVLENRVDFVGFLPRK